mmetsp:Transcript_91992/g.148556  ORF Transcript_91992/g.148556 Transcript_91992/m.148556 type:complete len:109 (-) Transcript_91992:68-394(-)
MSCPAGDSIEMPDWREIPTRSRTTVLRGGWKAEECASTPLIQGRSSCCQAERGNPARGRRGTRGGAVVQVASSGVLRACTGVSWESSREDEAVEVGAVEGGAVDRRLL